MSLIERLKVELMSETTFGSDKMSHEDVDNEVVCDEFGIPYIPARTMKGLLVEEAEQFCELLEGMKHEQARHWRTVAQNLFGKPGSVKSSISVGNGCIDERLKQQIHLSVQYRRDGTVNAERVKEERTLDWQDILDGFTTVRYQTAIDPATGTAKKHSLRSTRVILPGWTFYADFNWLREPSDEEEVLIAISAISVRRAGTQRNRGRGRIQIRCIDRNDQDVTAPLLSRWEKLLGVST